MKIFKVEFDPMWPVGGALVIAAENIEDATEIARQTVKHTDIDSIEEVDISKPCVIIYESGNY